MTLTGSRASAVVEDSFVLCPSNGRDRRGVLDAHRSSLVEPRVVSLRGEHDRSTADSLTAMLTGAITLDDADLVVDLRDVTFMDASTLGVLVGIRIALGRHGRTLALRSPSRSARRILDISGLSDLVEASPDAASLPASKAS